MKPSGEQIEQFRPYLTMLARTQMGPRLRRKYEPSDMVQLTMLQAYRGLDGFRGATSAEMAEWLRVILARNLAHAMRDLHRARRDAAREQSLEGALAASSTRLAGWLAAEQTSPSEKVVKMERLLAAARILETLPEGQRDAVLLHYFQGLTLAEVASELGRSSAAVASLIHRGLEALRHGMVKEGGR